MKKILIAGGGASGMAAAISAAAAGASVVLLEAREQTGKKLLRTGSGRCNFTNEKMDPDCFYGDKAFISAFLSRFSTDNCLDFFGHLGLLYKAREGYYYPYSNSAASVLSVLNSALRAYGVDVRLNSPLEKMAVLTDGRFSAVSGKERIIADALVVSSGSFAGAAAGYERTKTGTWDFLPENLGLRIHPFFPALTMLYGNEGCERVWEGVRCRGAVSYNERRECGELQLISKGISGIPVFQLSRLVIKELSLKDHVSVFLDFLPDYTEEEIRKLLTPGKRMEELLRGWLPRKLIPVILRRAAVFGDRIAESLKYDEVTALIHSLKHFEYRITGHGDFSEAQTVSGGVDTQDLTRDFESVQVPGLYFTGETVNIDGICGGYNLHFAFGSGILAGASAAQRIRGLHG